MMASSIIGSRIDYYNSLLIGISEQNLDRLQRVQSKAARIVCNASRQVTSSDLLYSLHCYLFVAELNSRQPHYVSKQ